MGAPINRGAMVIITLLFLFLGLVAGVTIAGVICQHRKDEIRLQMGNERRTAEAKLSKTCDQLLADALKQCGDASRQQFDIGFREGVRRTILHVKLVHDEPNEQWIAGMIAAAPLPLDEWRKRMRDLEPLGSWGEAPELEKVQPTPTPTPMPSPSPTPTESPRPSVPPEVRKQGETEYTTPSAQIEPGKP